MLTRSIWVLPDNVAAGYPFDIANPLNPKGLIFECKARITPFMPSISPSFGTYKGALPETVNNVRRIEILRRNLQVRPSTCTLNEISIPGVDGISTTTYTRTLNSNAWVFLKKPTLVWSEGRIKSTETGDVANPVLTATFSGVVDDAIYTDYGFGFRYTDDPSTYYLLSTLNDFGEPLNFSTNWFTQGISLPVTQGRKINFAIRYRDPSVATWHAYPGDYYVGSEMTLNINTHDSFAYTGHTLSYEILDVPTMSGFTTVNVPSWVIGPDGSSTANGYQGLIEYDKDLSVLDPNYTDIAPWENF